MLGHNEDRPKEFVDCDSVDRYPKGAMPRPPYKLEVLAPGFELQGKGSSPPCPYILRLSMLWAEGNFMTSKEHNTSNEFTRPRELLLYIPACNSGRSEKGGVCVMLYNV